MRVPCLELLRVQLAHHRARVLVVSAHLGLRACRAREGEGATVGGRTEQGAGEIPLFREGFAEAFRHRTRLQCNRGEEVGIARATDAGAPKSNAPKSNAC